MATKKLSKKVSKAMHRSGRSDTRVTSRKQAIAIGSGTRRSVGKVPKPRGKK